MINNKKNKPFYKSNIFLIALISFFALFVFLLKQNEGYTFEWDQSDDASKVFSIIQQKKPLLIGPRVSSDNGFFVGPYHYYYLLPFYILTKGDPVAGSYAVVFINILTTLISFFLIRKISNQKVAILSSFFISICLGKICWNAMYAPLIAIVAFYVCYQAIYNKFSFPLAMFFAGFISNIHLVPISLVPTIIFSFFISKNKPKIKDIFLGLLCFCIPFIPLMVFDLRHDFLNLNKLLLMIFGSKNIVNNYGKYIWLRSFWRSLNIFQLYPIVLERLLSLLILVISPFIFKDRKIKILIIVWILSPLLMLSLYKGAISEYYYSMVTSLIPLFLSLIIIKKIKNIKLIIIIVTIVFIFFIKSIIFSHKALVTLNDKKAIVGYLINQKQDQPFNLSYETDNGFNFGFDYLFNYYGTIPENKNNAHLYTLFTDNRFPPGSNIVFRKSIYSLVRR